MKQIKVTDEQCIDALQYFFGEGFVEEMTSDKRYYVTILAKKVAEELNISLPNEYV